MLKNHIKKIRKSKKVTQEKLAQLIGIHRTYLSYIENGKYQPSITLAINISNALGVKMEDLFFAPSVQYSLQKEINLNHIQEKEVSVDDVRRTCHSTRKGKCRTQAAT